jgi:hypothetical protein
MSAKKLTARFVEAVVTDLEREDFRDAAMRGLALRVTKAGSKTWTYRYRRRSDGRLRRVTLGSFPGTSLDAARQRAKEYGASIGRGADPAADVQARKQAETFAELAAEWVERHGLPNKGIRTLRDDRSMLERHVLPSIGSMKAAEITKRDLIRLFDQVSSTLDARTAGGDAPRRMTHRPNRVLDLPRFRGAL